MLFIREVIDSRRGVSSATPALEANDVIDDLRVFISEKSSTTFHEVILMKYSLKNIKGLTFTSKSCR